MNLLSAVSTGLDLTDRDTYIGGSEVFELENIAQYGRGCVRALGYRKLGIEPDVAETGEDDGILKRGEIFEPLIASMYEEATGREVRRNGGLRRHKDYPWAGVHVDRTILAGPGGVTETGDLEIKSRGEGPFWRVRRQGPFSGDLLQIQWAMFVTGHKWGALAILGVFGDLPLVHFDWEADRELHESFKRDGDRFANTVYGKGLLPDPPFDASDHRCRTCHFRLACRGELIDQKEAQIQQTMEKASKTLVRIEDDYLRQDMADLDLLASERKAIDEAIELTSADAMAHLGTHDAAYVRGYGKVYKLPAQANYIDSQALKAELPEVYLKYFRHRKTGVFFLRHYPERI